MGNIWQDLRYGLRQLRIRPLFTAVVVLSLAIGIGFSAATFGFVYERLMRPFPAFVRDSNRLVWLLPLDKRHSGFGTNFSYPEYCDYKDNNPVFSEVVAYAARQQFNLQSGDIGKSINGAYVSGNFFHALGVQAAAGRILTSMDCNSEAQPAAVVSYRLWKTMFSENPSVVGREIRLNRVMVTVIGVAPEQVSGLPHSSSNRPDIFVPLEMQTQVEPDMNRLTDRKDRWLEMIARLRPGVGLAQAQAAMQIRANQLQASDPDIGERAGIYIAAADAHPIYHREAFRLMGIMAILIALLLIIPCSNVASLLLAKAMDRRKEIAIRAALGAARSRIVRQLLTEALLLGLLGTLTGLFLTYWVTDFLAAKSMSESVLTSPMRLNITLLCFSAALSICVSLFFGLVPALHAMRINLNPELKNSVRQKFRLFRCFGARNLLVIANLACSLMVLVVAGLTLLGLERLYRIDFGFESEKLLIIPLKLKAGDYSTARARQFYQDLRERLKTLPDSTVAGLADPSSSRGRLVVQRKAEGAEILPSSYIRIGRGYFQTLNIKFLSGRDFAEIDFRAEGKSIIINESMAQQYWRGRQAAGSTIELFVPNQAQMSEPGRGRMEPFRVIGVVKDSVLEGPEIPSEIARRPFAYLPLDNSSSEDSILYVRTKGDPKKLTLAIRHIVSSLAPDLPLIGIKTLEEQFNESRRGLRWLVILTTSLGFLALGLASMGLYGVISYAVGRRTQEIGIRIAMGAPHASVLRRLIAEGLQLMAIGLIIGLVSAWIIAHQFSVGLNGIKPSNPLAYLAASLVCAIAAVCACYLPARRALNANPIDALRYE